MRFLKLYDRFAWRVDRAAVFFCAGLATVMFANVMAQIFFNYVLNNGLSWSEEFSRLLLVWITFSGAALVSKRSQHIGLSVVIRILPPRSRRLVLFAGHIVALIFLVVLVLWGWRLSVFGMAQTTTYMTISYFWFYLGVPFGGVLMLVQVLNLAFWELAGVFDPEYVAQQLPVDASAVQEA